MSALIWQRSPFRQLGQSTGWSRQGSQMGWVHVSGVSLIFWPSDVDLYDYVVPAFVDPGVWGVYGFHDLC